jgi:hypothetical protein
MPGGFTPNVHPAHARARRLSHVAWRFGLSLGLRGSGLYGENLNHTEDEHGS